MKRIFLVLIVVAALLGCRKDKPKRPDPPKPPVPEKRANMHGQAGG